MIDDIGFGNIKIKQSENGFRYGIDAVLLADFAARVCPDAACAADLGTGNGIVAFILSSKLPSVQICGFEKQEQAYRLACENIMSNGLRERVCMAHSDIIDIGDEYNDSFDLVTMNPPYIKKGAGIKNKSEEILIARQETSATIKDFIRAASRITKKNGSVVIVYRPDRLEDMILSARETDIYPAHMRMVLPYEDRDANIMMAHFIKGKRQRLRILPELVVREKSGEYTQEIKNIYK